MKEATESGEGVGPNKVIGPGRRGHLCAVSQPPHKRGGLAVLSAGPEMGALGLLGRHPKWPGQRFPQNHRWERKEHGREAEKAGRLERGGKAMLKAEGRD